LRGKQLTLVERYILREHLVPFLIGFGVVTFLLSMDFLFDYMDLFITKGVPGLVVLELYVLGMGWMVALSVPCAALVAPLMTFGRMAQDNELTALRAAGVSLFKVLRAPIAASILLAAALILFNNHVLPESNHAFANLMVDIAKKRPAVQIQEGVFINDFPGYSLLIGRLDNATSRMENVTIYELKAGGQPSTIIAKRGHLSYSPDGNTLTLELEDGEMHEVPDARRTGKYRRSAFERHVIHIQDVGTELERTTRESRSDREMSAQMMLTEVAKIEERRRAVIAQLDTTVARAGYPSYAAAQASLHPERRGLAELLRGLGGLVKLGPLESSLRRADGKDGERPELPAAVAAIVQVKEVELKALDRRMNAFRVEIHKKFAIPVACIVFVLIGAPLGIRARRGGFSIGFLSVAFFLFYYVCLIGGEQLADRSILPPALAMWIANGVLGTAGLILTLRTAEFSLRQLGWRRGRGGTMAPEMAVAGTLAPETDPPPAVTEEPAAREAEAR
jgi:lipopolysaccharide export system permease protein